MKKIIKLLFIPLTTTPFFCLSCSKKEQQPKLNLTTYDEKLKLIKDLIFIHQNLTYEDKNEHTQTRHWIGDMILNQAPTKSKFNKEIIEYYLQNKMNLIINHITNKEWKSKEYEDDEKEIKELQHTVGIILDILNEHIEKIKKMKEAKERDDNETEADYQYEWLLNEWKKQQKK